MPSPAPRIHLVSVPSDDVGFGTHARAVFEGLPQPPSVEEFERRIRRTYPAAMVRVLEHLGAPDPHSARWYATNRGYGSRIAATLEIAAPPQLVFDTYVDRLPEWQANLDLRLVHDEQERAGRQYATSYTMFGRRFDGEFRIVEADRPHSVVMEAAGSLGIRVWFATTFTDSPPGTRLRVVGDYDVPPFLLPNISTFLVQRVVDAEIDRSHAALRELCESEATVG